MRNLPLGWAIVAASLMLGLVNLHELETDPQRGGAYVINKLTGSAKYCSVAARRECLTLKTIDEASPYDTPLGPNE